MVTEWLVLGGYTGDFGWSLWSLPSRIIISYLACTYTLTGEGTGQATLHHTLAGTLLDTPLNSWIIDLVVTLSVFMFSIRPSRYSVYTVSSFVVLPSNSWITTGSVSSVGITKGCLTCLTGAETQLLNRITVQSITATLPLHNFNRRISLLLTGSLTYPTTSY